MKGVVRWIIPILKTLGYEIAINKKTIMNINCPSLPIPSLEIVRKAANFFSNSFSVSPNLGMTQEEIEKKIKSYYWHYPFEFDGLFVDASQPYFAGTHERHYQRYMHIFPAILSMTGGSSLSGNTVLDIAGARALTQNITIYDVFYIAAARKLKATLYTTDEKLYDASKDIVASELFRP